MLRNITPTRWLRTKKRQQRNSNRLTMHTRFLVMNQWSKFTTSPATKLLISKSRARVIIIEVQVNLQTRLKKNLKAISMVTLERQRISMSFILNSKQNEPTIIPRKKSQTLTVNQTFTKPNHSHSNSTGSNNINTKRVSRTKRNQIQRKRVLKTSGIRTSTKSKNKKSKPSKKRKKIESRLNGQRKALVSLPTTTGKTSEENDTQWNQMLRKKRKDKRHTRSGIHRKTAICTGVRLAFQSGPCKMEITFSGSKSNLSRRNKVRLKKTFRISSRSI